MLSHVQIFAAAWTITPQAPLSVGFSRQEYWSGLPFLPSRGSSRPRDQTHVSCISYTGRWVFYHWATWEAHSLFHTLLFHVKVLEPIFTCRYRYTHLFIRDVYIHIYTHIYNLMYTFHNGTFICNYCSNYFTSLHKDYAFRAAKYYTVGFYHYLISDQPLGHLQYFAIINNPAVNELVQTPFCTQISISQDKLQDGNVLDQRIWAFVILINTALCNNSAMHSHQQRKGCLFPYTHANIVCFGLLSI